MLNYCETCQRTIKTLFCLKCDRRRYNQAYYLANKAKILTTSKQWNAENPEKTREYHRRYYRRLVEAR